MQGEGAGGGEQGQTRGGTITQGEDGDAGAQGEDRYGSRRRPLLRSPLVKRETFLVELTV